MKSNITKLKQFTPTLVSVIFERDNGCLFCKQQYQMNCANDIEYFIFDTMHIEGKGRGGLGIIENGLQGCRWHHKMYDSNNPAFREDMDNIIDNYMTILYPNWKREDLIYKKYM